MKQEDNSNLSDLAQALIEDAGTAQKEEPSALLDAAPPKRGKEKGEKRTRNYATVVYPESAPANWLETLSEMRIPAFVSPLHNVDVNPGGEVKKEHFHVLIMFDSVKTKAQARETFDQIGGVGCETVNSIRGYARYLCHLDNPEKAQYSTEDVTQLAGADYIATISLASDRYAAIGEMMDFIDRHQVRSYAELMRYARDFNNAWFRSLCDNSTMVIKEYIKTTTWEART